MTIERPNQPVVTPASVRPHGALPRGLAMDTRSRLFEGRFGRLFRALPPADFGASDAEAESLLETLARAMIHAVDCPKDGADDEESGIPSVYTYLGQFVDHDITFDPASSLMRQNDPDALVDFRTPRLDLDSVYARGPDDQPYLYHGGDDPRHLEKTLIEGRELHGAALGTAIHRSRDLPRAANGRAVIGDPRNDENVIVSQLQGLFLRFHNRYRAEHRSLSFEAVQQHVRFHYQWVVTTDFLRRVVSRAVLERVMPHVFGNGDRPSDVVDDPPVLRFYHPRDAAFMPLEFSAAAYRFGHSMVRPGYRLNDAVGVLPIFALTSSPDGCEPAPDTLRGFRAMNHAWAIDWARFLDTAPRAAGLEDAPDEQKRQRLQLAYKIDPSLVDPLANLDASVTGPDPGVFRSLAARNLVRGWRMRLPSGQTIARAMGVTPLADEEIRIGAASDDAGSLPSITQVVEAFAGNCPLWTYVLAEAARDFRAAPESETVPTTTDGDLLVGTPKLGEVGGTIVAETFAGMMLQDRHSFWNLDPRWRPTLVGGDERFTLRELVRYALG